MDENKKDVEKIQKDGKKYHKLDLIALILCLIAALAIWLFVMNTSQETVEKTVILTVNVKQQIQNDTNMSIISGKDQTDYSQYKIELTVTGTQKALDKYEDTEYSIKLDTKDIKRAGKYSVQFLSPELPGNGEISFKSMSPSYIASLFIDEIDTREVALEAAPGEGGISGNGSLHSLTPIGADKQTLGTIKISGPKTVIDDVGKVIAVVNLAGYEKTTEIKTKTFEFEDVNGLQKMDATNYISVVQNEVNVLVRIDYTDVKVPVGVKYKADDTAMYRYTVTVRFEDNPEADAALALTGDSNAFSEKLYYNIDNKNDLENNTRIELTVGDMCKQTGFVPEGLTVGTDLSKKVIITVIKEKIAPDVTTDTSTEAQNIPSSDSDEIPAD